MNENVNRAMEELAALDGVHAYLPADGTIEMRPWPASPELSRKVEEIFERAGVRELRPWIWGVAKADVTLAARAKAVGRRLRASSSRVAAALRRRT
jgi:hypothetical protein